MSILEKIFGHKHKFFYVSLLDFKPMSKDSMYAKYTELWQCECGKQKTVSHIALI